MAPGGLPEAIPRAEPLIVTFFAPFLGLLAGSWGALGRLLARLGAVLAPLGSLLGAPGALLGLIWGSREAYPKTSGPPWAAFMRETQKTFKNTVFQCLFSMLANDNDCNYTGLRHATCVLFLSIRHSEKVGTLSIQRFEK